MKLRNGLVPLVRAASNKCSALCDGGTVTLDNCSSDSVCEFACNVEPCLVYSERDCLYYVDCLKNLNTIPLFS